MHGFKKGVVVSLMAFSMALTGISAINNVSSEPIPVYASLEDNVGGTTQGQTQDNLLGDIKDEEVSQQDKEVADWIRNQRGLSADSLNSASQTLSPITNLIGYVVGGIVVIVFIGITLTTALDLLYISFPAIRNLLYKAGTDGTGAYSGGMPGGGYPGAYGMRGVGGASGGTSKPTQWVSDEAVICASMIGGSAQSANNGPIGPNGQQNQVTKKSVITTYFIKRAVFMVMLVITLLVLTSSILLGTGVNLAQWLLKIISFFNGQITP